MSRVSLRSDLGLPVTAGVQVRAVEASGTIVVMGTVPFDLDLKGSEDYASSPVPDGNEACPSREPRRGMTP